MNANNERRICVITGSMAVEVARLGRKRFENVGGVDSAEVEDSVRRRSIILIMQPVGSCSSDYRGCHHCQTQCDRSIHCVFPLAFCETFQYVGADGCRYTKPSSTFRSSFVPADGTGAASYESGDFDTSPFLGSPRASRRPPVPLYLWYRKQSTMVQRKIYSRWKCRCGYIETADRSLSAQKCRSGDS